jgi:dTDP-4-amino-4,6-dideoxygalactose transaminase
MNDTSRPGAARRVPLAEPDLTASEAAAVALCVKDGWVSSAGPRIPEFEARIAGVAGRGHGVAAVNGTAALHLALIGVGVRPGDLVVVPDFTFAATANAVCHAGAVPFFVDIDARHWTLDPDLLDRALTRPPGGRRIGAVMMVDVLGGVAAADAIAEICRRHAVKLVEDAAGALGATWKGRPAGSFGAAACFSFNGNKTVTAGGGGMVVTDDAAMAARLRHLTAQARPSGRRYRHDAIGFNYRMTNLNAALGLAQLDRLEEMLAKKRAIARRYDAALAGLARLAPMPRDAAGESSCWLYSAPAASAAEADALVAALDGAGIDARHFWESLSPQPPYRDFPRLLEGRATAISGRVVSLPCSSSLTEADQARVIAALRAWDARQSARPAA